MAKIRVFCPDQREIRNSGEMPKIYLIISRHKSCSGTKFFYLNNRSQSLITSLGTETAPIVNRLRIHSH